MSSTGNVTPNSSGNAPSDSLGNVASGSLVSLDPDDTEAADVPEELNCGSELFDPLKFLYAPKLNLTKKKTKTIYQNMAAFDSALQKLGVWGLSSKKKPKKEETPKKRIEEEPMTASRRFLQHQMPVDTSHIVKAKHERNLYKQIEKMEGPQALLTKCVENKLKIKVYTRSKHGLHGTIIGFLISFDKHWNLLMREVSETWKRRKYKYGDNKFCGTPTDCSDKLRDLGLTLPLVKVKSISRKNVELSRTVYQLLVRGEQVAIVNVLAD